jgi:hypothetical protein
MEGFPTIGNQAFLKPSHANYRMTQQVSNPMLEITYQGTET